MPPTQRAGRPQQPAVAKAAGAAARKRSSSKNNLSLREAAPLLALLALLGLGAGAVAMLRGRALFPLASSKTSQGTTQGESDGAAPRTLKEAGVGLEPSRQAPHAHAPRRLLALGRSRNRRARSRRAQMLSTDEVERFKAQAVPLIYGFIFSRYEAFGQSKLTFRDMKNFLSKELGLPYEQLKTDELSGVIEDAVDAVTNACDAGKTVPRDDCAARFGFQPQQ